MRDTGGLLHCEWTHEGSCQVLCTDEQSHARPGSDWEFEEEKGRQSREISRHLGDSGVVAERGAAWRGVAWYSIAWFVAFDDNVIKLAFGGMAS